MAKVAPSDVRPSPLVTDTLLSVRNLRAGFTTDDGFVRAVDGVSFDIDRGDVLAIVGESGSGKSVTAMAILGLQPTLEVAEGEIIWKGRDLLTLPEDERRAVRGKEIAMIFQDPLTALNPVHTVGRQIGEMARIHEGADKRRARERAVEMLDLVGIPEARKRADMYPHEFSGGMRQRAMIAMAIACKPDLLIADEPTTALDVTVQAQVLEVLVDIKDEIDSAIILITHDLGVVAGLARRVLVMYAGRPVELGTTDEVFYRTRHPYALGLLASLPRLDDVGDEPLVPIVGTPPSLIRKPSGCAFHPRCRFARVPGICQSEDPALRLVDGDAHMSACHYAEELAEITIESLRQAIDVEAEAELADLTIPAGPIVRDGDRVVEEVDGAVVGDVAVAEIAHPGVSDFAEGEAATWPATGDDAVENAESEDD
ncbi:MAG TPA: ABC transporter ATP-binding protein [Acidimicrobiales bacterium]|nr:ABC transporter ATP-binding protein [Acidimicrobiales bacterium]